MMKTKAVFLALIAATSPMMLHAETMTNPYGETHAGAAVLANPYDAVTTIRAQRAEVEDENEMKIRQLYLQSPNRNKDAEEALKDQAAAIRHEDVSAQERSELLNIESPGLEVDRIAAAEGPSVPSLSHVGNGLAGDTLPSNLFLKDWELLRSNSGTPVVGRVGDPMSRINIRVGMVLGEFGRVMAVRDTADAYYIVLASGDRIRGLPAGQGG